MLNNQFPFHSMNELKSNHFVEQGLIQLASNETFMMDDQQCLNFEVVRLHSSKGNAEVYWRLTDGLKTLSDMNGIVKFQSGDTQKTIKVFLGNMTLDKETRIELSYPTDMNELGVIRMAKISCVCKYFTSSCPPFPFWLKH